MCGICGFYGDISSRMHEYDLKEMLSIIRHRGPDDEGIYLNDRVGLGMCRLSIIDVKKGHQPVYNETKTIWAVFNGEIYNYRSLREELRAKGHSFFTSSDSEVIVHLYEEYGEDFVSHIAGMFAIAVWDNINQRLLLVRDRMGVKPLYYYKAHDDSIVFASEVKALVRCGYINTGLNYMRLGDYLSYRYVPGEETMFENIYKLMPGHILICSGNSLKIKKYWDIDFEKIEQYKSKSPFYYEEKIFSLLSKSIADRLISDVPVGIFISGGLDSSIILSQMARLYGREIKSFSVAFEKPKNSLSKEEYDELNYARQVAEFYGSKHYEYVIKPEEVIDDICDMVWHLDEPLSDPTVIPLYYVSKLAKERVKVVISGEGADEIFAGYTVYKEPRAISRYKKLPSFMRRNIIEPIIQILPFKYGKDFIRRARLPVYKRYKGVGMTFKESEIELILNKDLLADIKLREEKESHLSWSCTMPEWADEVNQMLYIDQKIWLPEDVLMKADKISMAHSLELRVPFLDHKLVEFAYTIPSDLKYKGNSEKYILKQAFKNSLPAFVLKRKKNGFPVPISSLLNSEYKDFARDILLSSRTMNRGYFNRSYIEGYFTGKHKGNHTGRQIWMLVVFEIWHRLYIDGMAIDKKVPYAVSAM